jgi:two-component system sensor histidine kinase RegB
VIIGFSALLNLVLQIRFNPVHRLEPVYAAALLTLNIVGTRRAAVPHRRTAEPVFIPVPRARPDLGDGAADPADDDARHFAAACASGLVILHLPLPWNGDEPLVLPPIYMLGVWLSIVLAIGVTSLYAFQVTEEARKLSDALAATELVLTREQHLTQIDGLAAAAAHELGTPLSTIFLISRELEQSIDAKGRLSSRRSAHPARTGAAVPRHSRQDHAAVVQPARRSTACR